ncbi:MAG TPA: D-Ala-D-Ala carboxypeptidase family metallohydrolase [Rhodothermales bacterium]|nr:D-Ala-D-Ala carboxypeptidase family metallohydrolase [Rhodothermales bacterium]
MKHTMPIIGFSFLLTVILVVGPFSYEASTPIEEVPAQQPAVALPHQTQQPSALRRAGMDTLFTTPPRSLSRLLSFQDPTDAFSPSYYADSVTDGLVPLIMIKGLEDEFISRHFQIGDLVTRDGAPYARISTKLVTMLENIQWLARHPIHINSGYRHPAYNADSTVGGAPQSYHTAGLAADIWSPALTPGELAEIALATTECRIGIGLGANFIHVDLRDDLASWTRGEASMDEATFDAWVQQRCKALETGEELVSFETARAAAADSVQVQRHEDGAANTQPLTHYHDVMAAFAATQVPRHGAGAVLLDLRLDSTMQATGLTYRLSFIRAESEEARRWKLTDLIPSLRPEMYVAFAIISPDGVASVGAMRYDGTR